MKVFERPFTEKLELDVDVICTSECLGYKPGEHELPIDVNGTITPAEGYIQ